MILVIFGQRIKLVQIREGERMVVDGVVADQDVAAIDVVGVYTPET